MKYRSGTPLDVVSSAVETITYQRGTLSVAYKDGKTYQYLKVKRAEFDALRTADSIGRHLNTVIKPAHEFVKV
jgi:hypothetical protein